MPDNEFHDAVVRELARLAYAVETQGESIDRLTRRVEALPCLDPGPDSHAIRLDRLEQAEQRRRWAVRTAVGAALTALAASLGALWHGRG